MIVTVGGSVASGKSTLAKELSRRLGFKHLSAGEVMRQMASEKGMDIMGFSRFAETHPEVDREIDERQKIASSSGDCVVDGRLSAHFLKPKLNIWLIAPLDVRVKRVLSRGEGYASLEDAKKAIIEREASERRRYKDFYNIDLDDLGFYDVVLNTGKFGIAEMTELAFQAVKLVSGAGHASRRTD